MIGSKSKVAKTFEQLEKQGFDRGILEKVHAPIGLKIYSQSPQEIAVSIMAEIILKLRTVRTPA
jgi:xanthine dehydrogenase accessory factor